MSRHQRYFKNNSFKNKPYRHNRNTGDEGDEYSPSQPSSSQRHMFRGGSKHPRHLRGKDIGLFYSNRNKLKNEKSARMLGTILLSRNKKHEIKALLEGIPENLFSNFPQKKINPENKNCEYSDIKDSEFKTEFLKIISGSLEEKLNDPSLCKTLQQDIALDAEYYNELKSKTENNYVYKQMLKVRKKLPAYENRDEIIHLINNNQVVVISGETGCGKTTQVAQFILDDHILAKNGSVCRIICTQPRRISAISIAERVAQERGEDCGTSSVGFQIRLEKNLPRTSGSVTFCTTGVLLKKMQSDPFLSDVSHLILDEIHERNVVSDFVITILKQIISKRPDLKLILMSATLNSDQFCKYYNNCSTINIPGFTHPVEKFYLEDVLSVIKHSFSVSTPVNNWRKHLKHNKEKRNMDEEFLGFIEPYVRNIQRKKSYSSFVCENLLNPNSEKLDLELIVKLLKYICGEKEEDGSILVFLPGLADISKLNSEILKSENFPAAKFLIIPLHSKLPSIQQRKVFERPPKGMRKIVIATNIAETSITIDDIVFVIDCGKIKMTNYDVENDIESLKPEWESLANAKQRQGRAGRVQPGVCYHLFTQMRERLLEPYQQPEVQRSRLENIILTVKILQLGTSADFLSRLMDPPSPIAVENSLRLLKHMNALDSKERLTPLGYHLAKLPVNPRMGKMMLLGALFSCLDPILSIAASLDFKDAFLVPIDKQKQVDEKKRELVCGWKSDHLLFAQAIRRYEIAKSRREEYTFCREYFLSSHTLELLCNMKGQFADYLHEMNFIGNNEIKSRQWNVNSDNFSLIKAIVCASLYPNVAIVSGVNRFRKKIMTVEREKVQIHPNSVNDKEDVFESPLLVYHLKLKSSSIYLHDTTMVYPLPLLFFGDEINVEERDNYSVISLSHMLQFKCKDDSASLIIELRKQLDNLLKYKISHPGAIDWRQNSAEVAILRAIMELISSEDVGEIEFDTEDSD